MKQITILRRWNDPHITIEVTSESLKINMALENFILALTDEVAEPLVKQCVQDAGNPTLLFTNGQLEKRLVDSIEGKKAQSIFLDATKRIVEAVKGETSKIM